MIIPSNSLNFSQFGYSVRFDIYNRAVTFNIAELTVFKTGGAANVQGVAFRMVDEDGLVLCDYDFANQIPHPNTTLFWTLDLSNTGYSFLYQKYSITGAIKDQDGTITYLQMPIKLVSIPQGINESGYVCSNFNIAADCINNVLTVKDLTPYVYQRLQPASYTKTGTLNYPTGTIAAVSFTDTPFQNNVVYTGEMSINCVTVAEYDLEDNFYVDITYKALSLAYNVKCTDKVSDILCCVREVQEIAKKNCGNAVGNAAAEKIREIEVYFISALVSEMSGKDPSKDIEAIRDILGCDGNCGGVKQNEATPFNPATNAYSIVFTGTGGTTVPAPTVSGTTKNYTINSKDFVVGKSNPADTSFDIGYDTSSPNMVKYPITINYDNLTYAILTQIGSDSTALAQFVALVPPTTQVQSNWTESNSLAVDFIKNKPSIPAAQVNADWNAVSGVAQILNKPTIPSPVAQVQSNWAQTNSSDPSFINNKPTIPAAQVQADWNESNSLAIDFIKNKPAVITPVQSDWNEVNAVALDFIKNKPSLNFQPVEDQRLSTSNSPSFNGLSLPALLGILFAPSSGGLQALNSITNGQILTIVGGSPAWSGVLLPAVSWNTSGNSIGFAVTSTITGGGTQAIQYANGNIVGALVLNSASNITTHTNGFVSGVHGDLQLINAANNVTGGANAVSARVGLNGGGTVDRISGVMVKKPYADPTGFSGTVTDFVGVDIEDLRTALASIGGTFTNVYATRQLGTSDINLFAGKMRLPNLPVYADNTAATSGGLVVGDVYRTSTGVMMVRY